MKHRIVGTILTLAAALAAGGCGFHPLYGELDHGPGGQQVFGSIYVDPIEGELTGYHLRNTLIDMLKGPSKPAGAIYHLKVTTNAGVVPIAVEPDASITRYNFNILAHYQLFNIKTGALVKGGSETTLTEYDAVQSPYATLVARHAAETRATEDIAYRIRVDLAVYFHNAK